MTGDRAGDDVVQQTETRARRRIRKAVESRGYQLVHLEWEPWSNGGEKSGICGGWYGRLDRPTAPNIHPGDDIVGLTVEELLAHIDQFVPPPEPCACPEPDSGPLWSHTPLFMHEPGCKWRLRYWLRWWTR